MTLEAINVRIEEGDRQLILLALAKLSLERPGWLWTLDRLARTLDGASDISVSSAAALFEQFRELHGPEAKPHFPAWEIALAESVRLQAHYAELLNSYDGGARMTFASADEWMQRLVKCGTIPEDKA